MGTKHAFRGENLFLPPGYLGAIADPSAPSAPIHGRALGLVDSNPGGEVGAEISRLNDLLTRGDVAGDLSAVLGQFAGVMQNLNRNIATGTTAFPVRENLEAPALALMPLETPLRNRIPRVPGAGTAAAWRQLTQLGATTTTGISAQAFFGEAGAPAVDDSVYVAKSASYKLLGKMGGITGFAMAAGANFQNQLAAEKTNKLRAVMMNEENAIINGSATSTTAPYGDGTTAFGFDGLLALTATANGTPAAQVQTTVGALTLAHIDAQLQRLWNQGGRGQYIVASGTEVLSLVHLTLSSSTPNRVVLDQSSTQIGVAVKGYIHPITGEIVPVIVSRFLAAGTMLFGCDYLPDGNPALEIDVLPQVQLPELAPNQNIQGYVVQEIAPAAASPQLFPFLVSVYEVLKMKSALHFCKSTGITAV
jgi:hypothetical protein